MTDAITHKHQKISTGFLNKIEFPSGYDGDRKKKIDSGDLVELLVDNCSPRLTYNLLTLEPEFDGFSIGSFGLMTFNWFFSEREKTKRRFYS